MDEVGPVVMEGNFAFCCECEAGEELPEVLVLIFEKPEKLPADPLDEIPKTRVVGKRYFKGENSMLHIRNFIIKFSKDPDYRKEFITAS
jgi:hypothetical protein